MLKKKLPCIYFTVTNDLSYDQRMIRICTSLSRSGFDVVLIGRKLNTSLPLDNQPFRQKRLSCFFNTGKLFYLEYNLRLFFFLLFRKMGGICAIDLDTIIPALLISRIKKVIRIYDAHELFCEMKEVVSRPAVYRVWKWIERNTVPYFKYAYTVNEPIADELFKMYNTKFEVIRSISVYNPCPELNKEKIILYQGAVNEGRHFENLIPAMKEVNASLYICGDGNFMKKAKELSIQYGTEKKIYFLGLITPAELKNYTCRAYIGITLFESDSLSNYYSLANRFFDYMHGGTPQLCSDYPVYREINNSVAIAVVIKDHSPASIAKELNLLLNDKDKWLSLHENCKQAAKKWNWQEEEKKLIRFYNNIFG